MHTIDTQITEQNQADLQQLLEIFLEESRHVQMKASALLSSKLGDVSELQRTLDEVQLGWDVVTKQRNSLEGDIERVARERLQCRVAVQDVDNEKMAVEARCAAMVQQLSGLRNCREQLIAETKHKWEKLVYAGMYYKLRLSCHISLDELDDSAFTFEFFQTQRDKQALYFVKLSHNTQDGKWILLDMCPRLAQFNKLCTYLEKSQDIQRLVVYLHHKFAALRDTMLC